VAFCQFGVVTVPDKTPPVFYTNERRLKRSMWIVVPSIYEKWVHPSAKTKHYRAIFRSSTGGRRYSKTKFKTATDALAFAVKFNLHLCRKKEEGG
jgi:hypothetical protein